MTLSVEYNGVHAYDIVCVSGNPVTGVLSGIGDELPFGSYLRNLGYEGRRVGIVTDSDVAPLYLEAVVQEVTPFATKVAQIVLPAGEEHKHLGSIHAIYEQLKEARFDRHDVLVALGGGVVGDMTGFAAATYLRGIDFVQVPTTLLSQTDSSIGGKTGVDFKGFKNMIGAFYMPKLVYIHTQVLKTLPARQVRSGLAEVVKYGLICDASFYERVARDLNGREFIALLEEDPAEAEALIVESCRYKKEVVEEDPTEQGRRAILNFGHTIGHAVEKTSEFTLLHGECVALGSIAAAFLSLRRGMISKEDFTGLKDAFHAMGLPVSMSDLDASMNAEEVISAMRSDKKADGGNVKFVLVDGIGNAVIASDVTEEEVTGALEEIGITGGRD